MEVMSTSQMLTSGSFPNLPYTTTVKNCKSILIGNIFMKKEIIMFKIYVTPRNA
jgi:hypothetical protein